MQLAPLHLPSAVNGAVQFFCLFELFNACQSFALGVTLAGGQDDTPLDLVSDWDCGCGCVCVCVSVSVSVPVFGFGFGCVPVPVPDLSSPLFSSLLLPHPTPNTQHPTHNIRQVKWKAWLRALRFLIDLGCFVLRLVLWVQYNALSSVFLIKNLYNLLHTYAQIER